MFDCGVVLHLKLGNPQGSTLYHTTLLASSLQGADPRSIASAIGITVMDLGSVNAPPPLDHRDSGVGWSVVQLVLDVMRNRIALG